MREILLVDQAPAMIEHHGRLPNGHWEIDVVRDPGALIDIVSLNFQLPAAEIYRNIELLSA